MILVFFKERQVRVEMHKKVVGAKADLEKRLQGTEAENERLKVNDLNICAQNICINFIYFESNSQVEMQTQEKKLEQITREKE